MKTLEKMVIGLTMTDSDSHLLRYAAMLQQMGIGKSLDFVHIQCPTPASEPVADMEQMRLRMQDAVKSHLGSDEIEAEMRCHVFAGAREDRLADFAERNGAGLILLGYRQNRRGKRSLARRLAMIAPASVWMVPEDAPIQITRVLAPIDFSSHSADSLSVACGISRKAGLSECDALHVFFDASVIRYEDAVELIRGEERSAYEQFVRPIETYDATVHPVFEESSNVSRAILRVAEQRQSDLIVMNTRGRSAAASVLIGSETSQTIMESKIPVLAVKHRGAHMNLLQVLTNPEFWSKPSPHTN